MGIAGVALDSGIVWPTVPTEWAGTETDPHARVVAAGDQLRFAGVGHMVQVLSWTSSWDAREMATVSAWAEIMATELYSVLHVLEGQAVEGSEDLHSLGFSLRMAAETRDRLESLRLLLKARGLEANLQGLLVSIDELGASVAGCVGLTSVYETERLMRASELYPDVWWTGGTLPLPPQEGNDEEGE